MNTKYIYSPYHIIRDVSRGFEKVDFSKSIFFWIFKSLVARRLVTGCFNCGTTSCDVFCRQAPRDAGFFSRLRRWDYSRAAVETPKIERGKAGFLMFFVVAWRLLSPNIIFSTLKRDVSDNVIRWVNETFWPYDSNHQRNFKFSVVFLSCG